MDTTAEIYSIRKLNVDGGSFVVSNDTEYLPR
jgi:hypothetical protein